MKSLLSPRAVLWPLLAVLWMITGLVNLQAQSILPNITAANAPTGTSLTAPHYIIDSDADNADPAYNRNAVPGSAEVFFSRAGGVSSATETFRVIASLINAAGTAVPLSNGSTFVASSSQSVSLSAILPTQSRTFQVLLAPAEDIGAGVSLSIRYTVQRQAIIGTLPGGTPLFGWLNADGPDDSAAFFATHFQDRGVAAENVNARGWLRGGATYTKSFAVSSGNATQRSFSVQVPYSLARYDLEGVTQFVTLRFTATLTDDLGNSLPLTNNGLSSVSLSRAAFVAGTPNQPSILNTTRTVTFTPTGQLDSANRTFTVTVRFEHIEVSPSTIRDNGTSSPTPAQRLLHFNGNLAFGAIATTFDNISNTPAPGALGVNLINTTLNSSGGLIPSHPAYSYGTGADLNVRLLSNGDAVVTGSGTRTVDVAGGGQVEALFGGVKVRYPGTSLTSAGAVAGSAVIELPQGLSFTPNRATSAGRYLPVLAVSGARPLSTQFRHNGLIQATFGADAWVFDESRPLLYQVANFAFLQTGQMDFNPVDSEWAHKASFEQLEQQHALGQHQNTAMRDRLTNEGYLFKAKAIAGNVLSFLRHNDGSVRTHVADLDIQAGGRFLTHFPFSTRVLWSSAGTMKIRSGKITDDSFIDGVAKISVGFDGSCQGDACGPPPGSAVDVVEMTADRDALFFTSDGGLQAWGQISPKTLKWGIRGGMTFTHRSDELREAFFQAPGNQLYENDHPLAKSGPLLSSAPVLAPASLLLAGYDHNQHTAPVYPQTSRYRDGVGSYAGMTMVSQDSGAMGASRLADMSDEYPYLLMPDSTKYYVRRSGVSGRHVGVDGSFAPELRMYDYQFLLTSYQLTFLSNSNHESWVNGSVDVPYPSNFNQSFVGLRLSCTGALEGAEIDPDDAGSKSLAYWNGSFLPMAIRFAPAAGAGCYDPRFLTIGLVSGAANLEKPLAGSLAFRANGNIATLADNIEGVDGRLGLPARVDMAGPGSETYPLVPVCKLYFNNPTAPNAPPTGFVSFAATCNVPFFEDLKVHVMTSAQAGIPAPLHMAGGWNSGADTHFTQARFDASHHGLPPGVSVTDYQSPTAVTPHVVRARQSLFGLIPLDYPLQWNPTARFFQSWPADPTDLLVLTLTHQIDDLRARNAEISFGAQYDGLPKINLVSAATEIVEGQLGAARALTQAAQSYVTNTLNQGVEEIGNLVNDTMENVLDQAITSIEQRVIDPLYDAVVTSYSQARAANDTYNGWVDSTAGDLTAVFNRYFDGSVVGAAHTIKGELDQLAAATTEASSLIFRVQQAVDRGILAIDSITGQIQTYRNGDQVVVALSTPPGFTTDELINGLLRKVSGPGGVMERQIVQALVRALIRELAPPDLATVLNPLLSDLSSEINAELNTLLARFDPTLDRISDALIQARAFLVQVKTRLTTGGNLLLSFNQIITAASAEIDALVAGVRTMAYDIIDRIRRSATILPNTVLNTAGNLIDEFNKEEFVALLRAELRDRLLATEFIRQIQYTLRQTISEFDIALRSAIDSAFNEVNRMCKELIKSALGPIDDTINGLIGDINSYVGAGSVDGYAHIQGDTLRRLRIDAMVQLKVPDEMKLQGYFEMLCYDSETTTGSAGCLTPGQQVVEVKIGAIDVPLDWISPDLRANLDVWFSMQTAPSVRPRGIGGALTMTGGELDFQSFKITGFGASVAVGVQECFLAATARVVVSSYEASGGIFFGRTCTLTPLTIVDPDAASLLGSPPFTGAYVYGEVWIPISEVVLGIPASCLFRISAGVGAGAFYFVEGPTYGGRMMLGASGEALCVVSIRGEVSMTGVMSAGSLKFSGRGKLSGKAGYCPFCVKFNKSAKVTYQNGSWSVDL